jgi:hypothetical protein
VGDTELAMKAIIDITGLKLAKNGKGSEGANTIKHMNQAILAIYI